MFLGPAWSDAVNRTHRRKWGEASGFTLVELLVVVAIIATLMAILLPALGKARDAAKEVKCLVNQRTCGTAMLMYSNDWNGWLPSADGAPGTNRYRLERNWDICMRRNGYLPDGKVIKWDSDATGYTWDMRYADRNVATICPAIEPGDFADAKQWYASKWDYGIRRSSLPNDANAEKTDGQNSFKLGTLNMAVPFLADTVLIQGGVPRSTVVNFKPNIGETTLMLNRVHDNALNAWMPDGHAQLVSPGDLDRMAIASYPF